jgi:1-acyl-sn-glycerol-3-phosphate acyltransferase
VTKKKKRGKGSSKKSSPTSVRPLKHSPVEQPEQSAPAARSEEAAAEAKAPKSKAGAGKPKAKSKGKNEPKEKAARTNGKGRQASKKERRQEELAPTSSAPSHIDIEDVDDLAEEAPELGIGSRMIPPHMSWSDPLDSMPPASPIRGDVAEQIKSLEARLDGLIRTSTARGQTEGEETPDESAEEPRAVPARVKSPEPKAAGADELSATPYFEKQWGRKSLTSRSEEVDDFGLDPAYESKVRPVAEFLYRRYFRVKTTGIENLPSSGRCIIVANHSGTLPLDGLMLRTAMQLERGGSSELRWLAEDFLFYLPFAGVFMNRVGAVRACQENAERLLEKERMVAVFPEGVQGIKKLFRDRYRLQRFGRGGYIRLALRMRAPIIPCSIVGAEETNPLLYRVEYLAGLVGLPYIPVTPTFPFLGPLGLLPAPSRWRITFGEPVSLDHHGPEAADDHVLVGRLSDRVRGTIQSMLDSGVRDRRSVWFG